MPQITPTTSVHYTLSKLGTSEEQEDEILDLTRLTYDQFTHKFRQEKRRCLARNPAAALAATTEKDIVLDTRTNPIMIASMGTTFATATEENFSRMSREILSLQKRLQTSEQRAAQVEYDKKGLEEEVQRLQFTSTQANDFPLTIQRELGTLEATMKSAYEEMFTIK